MKNVHFINNTVTGSGHENGGGLRVNHGSASGIVMRNKIAWNNVDYDIRPGAGTHTESNLCGDSLCEIQESPQFIDPQNDDFRLAATSPAIDVGLFWGRLHSISPESPGRRVLAPTWGLLNFCLQAAVTRDLILTLRRILQPSRILKLAAG